MASCGLDVTISAEWCVHYTFGEPGYKLMFGESGQRLALTRGLLECPFSYTIIKRTHNSAMKVHSSQPNPSQLWSQTQSVCS